MPYTLHMFRSTTAHQGVPEASVHPEDEVMDDIMQNMPSRTLGKPVILAVPSFPLLSPCFLCLVMDIVF